MAFEMTLAFVTEHDRDDFVARALPRTRAHEVARPEDTGAPEDGMQHLTVAVTSASAARDLVHQVVAFLAHAKNTRVDMRWSGVDGQQHVGEVSAGESRGAEVVAVRVSTAAKSHLDAEKAAGEPASDEAQADAEGKA